MENDDLGLLPDSKPVPTPEQTGAALQKSLSEEEAKSRLKSRLDALDFDDPASVADSSTQDVPAPEARPKASPVPVASPVPAFDPELLARAREHGISATEAKEYGDPKSLERALGHLDRAISRQRPAPQAAPAQQPTPEPEPEWEFPELPDVADEGQVWDANLQRWVQGARTAFGAVRDENKQLKQSLNQIQQQLQQQQIERVTSQWDGFFDAAPAEFKEGVGEGSIADLQGLPAERTRQEVYRTYLALEASYKASGQRPPSFKTLAERALRAVVTPKAAATPAADQEERIRDHQGRFAAAPAARSHSANSTQINGDTPPKDGKARDAWAARRFQNRAKAIWGND